METVRLGGLSHMPGGWDAFFTDSASFRETRRRLSIVYESANGLVDGYAAYRITRGWENGFPAEHLDLQGVNVITVTVEARADLWRSCLTILRSHFGLG